MTATLELLHDGAAVEVLGTDVVVGRTSRCGLRVVHPLVSREHCRMEVRADGLYVIDLASVNGTWINGSRIEARTQARAGDRVGLGRDGAVLVVRRATVDGVDVASYLREEDKETLRAGDPRAAGVEARVDAPTDEAPAATPPDEAPTGPIPVIDGSIVRHVQPAATATLTEAVSVARGRPCGFAHGLVVGLVVGLVAVAAVAMVSSSLRSDGPAGEARRPR